eukprot:gene117-biopygen3423
MMIIRSSEHRCMKQYANILTWLGSNHQVNLCVQYTNIGFNSTCRKLVAAMSTFAWIHEGRISFAYDDEARKLDQHHAKAFEEGRVLGMHEAFEKQQQQVMIPLTASMEANKQAAQNILDITKQQKILLHELTITKDSCQSMRLGVTALSNYHLKQNDSYDILVTSLMKMHLHAGHDDVSELPRSQHKIERVPDVFPKGVEWDGVLYAEPKNHLYLIEAKSSVENSHIAGMQARMKRTAEFIDLCATGSLPVGKVTTQQRQLCAAWATYSGRTEIFSVVGAPDFTEIMHVTAEAQGIITVYPKGGWYAIQPPKQLWSCVNSKNPGAQQPSAETVKVTKEQLDEAQELEFEREHVVVE